MTAPSIRFFRETPISSFHSHHTATASRYVRVFVYPYHRVDFLQRGWTLLEVSLRPQVSLSLSTTELFHYIPFPFARARPLMQRVFEAFENNCLKGIAGTTQSLWCVSTSPSNTRSPPFQDFPSDENGDSLRTRTGCCHHFYRPEEALTNAETKEVDWRVHLHELSAPLAAFELAALSDTALRAVSAIDSGAWLIDFALDVDGKWWLVEMATAGRSCHPECAAK